MGDAGGQEQDCGLHGIAERDPETGPFIGGVRIPHPGIWPAGAGEKVRHASSAKVDKFGGIRTRKVKTGSPIFRECITWFDCRVERAAASGDNRLIIGRIVASGRGIVRKKPLVYRSSEYE